MQLDRHTLPDGLQLVNGSDNNGGCSRVVAQGRICGELVEVISLIVLFHPWEDFKATGQLDSSL